MRVLVAEDERLLADTIAEGLRRRSMAVDVCYDGDVALEWVAVNRYDVVILDRDLPAIHGDELCQIITHSEDPAMILELKTPPSASQWQSVGDQPDSAAGDQASQSQQQQQ